MRSASTGSPAASRRADCRRTEQGFTLLETLVALTILAVALTALLGSYADGLKAAGTNDRYNHAQALAQTLLAQAAVDRQRVPTSSNGTSHGFRWKLQVGPASSNLTAGQVLPNWQLYRVVASVRWGRNRSYKLETLRLARRKQ